MPLTPKGKKILKKFRGEYGLRDKNVFYAFMKKYPGKVKKWHK